MKKKTKQAKEYSADTQRRLVEVDRMESSVSTLLWTVVAVAFDFGYYVATDKKANEVHDEMNVDIQFTGVVQGLIEAGVCLEREMLKRLDKNPDFNVYDVLEFVPETLIQHWEQCESICLSDKEIQILADIGDGRINQDMNAPLIPLDWKDADAVEVVGNDVVIVSGVHKAIKARFAAPSWAMANSIAYAIKNTYFKGTDDEEEDDPRRRSRPTSAVKARSNPTPDRADS